MNRSIVFYWLDVRVCRKRNLVVVVEGGEPLVRYVYSPTRETIHLSQNPTPTASTIKLKSSLDHIQKKQRICRKFQPLNPTKCHVVLPDIRVRAYLPFLQSPVPFLCRFAPKFGTNHISLKRRKLTKSVRKFECRSGP